MTDSRPARLAALRRALTADHIDALLLTSRANIRYVTGFSGSSAFVVVTQADVVLLTDFRYETQAPAEVGGHANVLIEKESLWTRLWSLLPGFKGVERAGFESVSLAHRDFERIREHGTRWRWKPTSDVVETLRAQKDAGEVARIRRAAAVAGAAFQSVVPDVRAGMSELAVAGLLEHALRDAGSEGHPFDTIVAAGARSALPHARASDHVIRAGDFVLIDFGAVHEGYCSDITRTVVMGRASDEQRAAYQVVREAQAVAIAGLRPGLSGRDADALARSYIERAGFGGSFGHSLGHGVGLEVHEAPRLARTAETALPARSVVTVEPGVYRPGWGGVRIEDDVFLGEAGPEVLTTLSRELQELA